MSSHVARIKAVFTHRTADSASRSRPGNRAKMLAVGVFCLSGRLQAQESLLHGLLPTEDAKTIPLPRSGDQRVDARPAESGVLNGQAFSNSSLSSVRQRVYLKAPNPDRRDSYGVSVAISDNLMVIGASGEGGDADQVDGLPDNAANSAGAAYVYERSGQAWVLTAYLKASNSDAGDLFGASVAVSGDTIAVGAPGEDGGFAGVNSDPSSNSRPESGAAYVFVRSGASWSQQAYIKASNPDPGDVFGTVALDGDTLLVGATFEDGGSTGIDGNQASNSKQDSGAVYAFTRSGSTWTQEAYIKAPNSDAEDAFGLSLAVQDDRAVVGAFREDSDAVGINGDQGSNDATNAGAAYVFRRLPGGWANEAYLKASNTDSGDLFGARVDITSERIIVGASGEDGSGQGQGDNSSPLSGAGYVYVRVGTTWSQEGYLKPATVDVLDAFGFDVGIAGKRAVISALWEDSASTGVDADPSDNGASTAGAGYLFTFTDGEWSQEAYLKASNTDAGDWFGYAVDVEGTTAVIGALGEESRSAGVDSDQSDNGWQSVGAAYVFEAEVPAGEVFCTSLVNSTGFEGELHASGDPTTSLVLTASSVPDTVGLMAFGTQRLNGVPFGDGILCIGGVVQRMHPSVVAGAGSQPAHTAVVPFDYSAPYAAGLTGTRYFQYWFRSGLGTGAGFNTTHAIAIGL